MNPYRDRFTGRYTSNPTARAIAYVIANWHFCACRDLAASNDSGPGDEPAAA